MGWLNWLSKAAPANPGELTQSAALGEDDEGGRLLFDQYGRIGGNLTPRRVGDILRDADCGRPAQLFDLGFEARQKDGHLQNCLGIRDRAVALCDLKFTEPEDATADERKATDLCKRIRDEFENFETLVEGITSAYWAGFSASELKWRLKDGFLVPYRAVNINPRYFIFDQFGRLRYVDHYGDQVGVNLLEEYPGRVIQVQRRITGDAPAREGLLRVLTWAALFRNWSVRDWIALGEIGWKPWRLATYEPDTKDEDVRKLIKMMEKIGASGVGAYKNNQKVDVHWPKGTISGRSTHNEFFGTMGGEISKAILGQTTSVEAGPNGDRGGVQARDAIRKDVHESDARADAAGLFFQMFSVAVAVNYPNARPAACAFATDDAIDGVRYSEMVKNLVESKVRIDAREVREDLGFEEPTEDSDVIGESVQVPDNLGGTGATGDTGDTGDTGGTGDTGDDDDEDDKSGRGDVTKGAQGAPPTDGQEYADRLSNNGRRQAAGKLTPFVATLITEIQEGASYEEIQHRITAAYRGKVPPVELARMVQSMIALASLGGHTELHEES